MQAAAMSLLLLDESVDAATIEKNWNRKRSLRQEGKARSNVRQYR
jgi:hypothetical protein